MSSMNNIPVGNNARSISVWMFPTSLSTTWTWNAVAYGSPSTNNAFMFGLANNSIVVQGWTNGYDAPYFYPLNQWLNAVCTYDGLNVFIYVNGSLVGSGTIPNLNTTGSNFYFGIRPSLVYGYFPGKLDDIGIWNRVLTQQEITALYNGCQLSINTQPTNQNITVNNNAQFIVNSSDPNATYQWQTDLGVGFQNLSSVGQYSGANNDTLIVSYVTFANNNQPFRCIVNSGSCSDTSNVAVLTVNNNVGINEISNNNLFAIYPNPANTIINIKSDAQLIGKKYFIFDNLGKTILTGKITSENMSIDINNLSEGNYLIGIDDNSKKQSFKVIKN